MAVAHPTDIEDDITAMRHRQNFGTDCRVTPAWDQPQHRTLTLVEVP